MADLSGLVPKTVDWNSLYQGSGFTAPKTGAYDSSGAIDQYGARLFQPSPTYNTSTTQTQPTSTTPSPTPTTTSGGGGGGGRVSNSVPLDQQARNMGFNSVDELQQWQAAREQVRNDINSGYSAFFSNLDAQLGKLPGQEQQTRQIVDNNYNQGLSDINAQKESSLGDLNTQRRKTQEGQVSSLNDLAENIRNLFRTGSVKLGALGAGDSSAANQYSYAIGKLGSKQRGNILTQTRSIENDIQDREAKLNNIVTQETAKLKTNRDNKIIEIAQWYQDKVSELQNMKAQGQLQKGQSLAALSTQLLQVAQQRLMQADADVRNQQNLLTQWAVNQSNTLGELKNNLAQVGSYQAANVQPGQVAGGGIDAGGNVTSFYGFGNTDDDQNRFF